MSSMGSRAGTLRLVGGRPCLDLVNTVSWRGAVERREDHLADPEACLVWAARAGVLDADEVASLRISVTADPAAGKVLVDSLRALRTTLDQALVERDAPGLAALQPRLDDALGHSHLVPAGDGSARWEVSTVDPLLPTRRIVLDLYDLLRHP